MSRPLDMPWLDDLDGWAAAREARDEQHARTIGNVPPSHRWVSTAEIHSIDAEMKARSEKPWNGCLHHYLTARYGERLYHVMGGGWFVREEQET
jgi:hypothetical protein